jgi:hypothetical protein
VILDLLPSSDNKSKIIVQRTAKGPSSGGEESPATAG